MGCEAEELVGGVGGKSVDQQTQVNGNHSFAQQHIQPGLVFVLGRTQQADEGAHTCEVMGLSGRHSDTQTGNVASSTGFYAMKEAFS